MSPALHFERLLPCLIAVLLVTGGGPTTAVAAASGPPVADLDGRTVVLPDIGGGTANASGGDADAAKSAVAEGSLDGLRTWVAPKSAALSNLSAIESAKATENLTRSSALTKNDTLVLELRASELEGPLAAQDGANATARFFALLDGDATDLEIVQMNPGPSIPPKEIRLAESDSTRVVADSATDSYYLVADLADVNVTGRSGELDEGDEYEATVSVAESSALASNGTESVTTRFAIVEPTAELTTAGERREFTDAAPNRTLYGSTSLPPGATATVELVSADGDRQFSETVRVRNGSSGVGRFAASFDLSDAPEGTNFTADVRAEAYPELDFDATHVVVSEPTARVGITTAKSTGGSVDATLSHGGFVAVRRGSVDGDLLGRSQYLDAGTDENGYVSFEPDLESNATLVAVAYHDTDRDGEFDPGADEPYTDGRYDHRVATSKKVTVEESEPTTKAASETTVSSMRGETTTAVVTESVGPADLVPPGIGSPDFGVPVALVVLLVVTLLARRR